MIGSPGARRVPSGEFANRKGIYPPFPGAEKFQYV
jgi:hypothetical protein